MDDLTLQEACLLELLRQAAEAQAPLQPLAIIEELREMRLRLEAEQEVEAEEFMIRPYTAQERQRLVGAALR